jgi:hypothetical protein
MELELNLTNYLFKSKPKSKRGEGEEQTCDWGWPRAALHTLDAVHQQRRPRLMHRQARIPVVSAAIIAAAAAMAPASESETTAAGVPATHAVASGDPLSLRPPSVHLHGLGFGFGEARRDRKEEKQEPSINQIERNSQLSSTNIVLVGPVHTIGPCWRERESE